MTRAAKGGRPRAPAPAPPKPRASGPTIPEDVRLARGQTRITLRLPAAALALLDAECARSGYTRSEMVEELIRRCRGSRDSVENPENPHRAPEARKRAEQCCGQGAWPSEYPIPHSRSIGVGHWNCKGCGRRHA